MQWVGNEFFCEKRCRVSRAVSRSVVDGAGPKPRRGRPVKSCLTVPDLMRDARADSALLAKFLHAGCTPTRLGVGLNSKLQSERHLQGCASQERMNETQIFLAAWNSRIWVS